tara:strand:+ start:642 stop:842 length:201 start_codon:yes stop_codon:yes gene_type:complete
MKLSNPKLELSDFDNIPDPIKNLLDAAAQKYSESLYTTNAGFFLRFICKFIKPSTIIKMFAYKISK